MINYRMIEHLNEVFQDVKSLMTKSQLPYSIKTFKENEVYKIEIDLSALNFYDNDVHYFYSGLFNVCLDYKGDLDNNPTHRYIYKGYEIVIYTTIDTDNF